MTELPSGPLVEADPAFARLGLETGQLTYALPATTVREKVLQNLADDVCRGDLGLAFQLHVTSAHLQGLSYADLLALIRFVAPYAGYPAAADAIGRVGGIAAAAGMDTSVVEDAAAPAGAGTDFGCADPWLADFARSRSARAAGEKRLDEREQALVALTAAISLGTFGLEFAVLVHRALDVAGPDAVRDAVRFCGETGLMHAVRAMAELDALV